MKAVISIGGQQLLVNKGDTIVVDHINQAGKQQTFEPILVFDDKTTFIGNPTVKGAKVIADVVEADAKGDKVKIMKFQAKKRVKKLTGHRQAQTKLVITSVETK